MALETLWTHLEFAYPQVSRQFHQPPPDVAVGPLQLECRLNVPFSEPRCVTNDFVALPLGDL